MHSVHFSHCRPIPPSSILVVMVNSCCWCWKLTVRRSLQTLLQSPPVWFDQHLSHQISTHQTSFSGPLLWNENKNQISWLPVKHYYHCILTIYQRIIKNKHLNSQGAFPTSSQRSHNHCGAEWISTATVTTSDACNYWSLPSSVAK